jgi:hypothetical protein
VGWRLWLWCSPRRPRPYCGEFGLRVGRLGLREYGTDFVVDRCQHAAIAQIGSAIGREFTHELLAVVATKPESELRSALEQLIGAGLIFARGTLPEATYLFKHALVQDVAHGTLLRRSRQELHARIADALERQFPETLESRPELSAYHLTRAGLVAKAVHFWLKAGEREGLSRIEAKTASRSLAIRSARIADPRLSRIQECLQGLDNGTFFSLPECDHLAAFARSDLVLPHATAFLAKVSQDR